MLDNREHETLTPEKRRAGTLIWGVGLYILPFLVVFMLAITRNRSTWLVVAFAAVLLAPLPVVLLLRRERRQWATALSEAEEERQALKLQLDAVRFRTGRLREELSAADKQARLSHQLTLLGQFTAGFMHEFNNPLAIVSGRLEVLLDERKEDASLCADIEQMLKETRYMGRIAGTLLQALRRERASEVFDPSVPAKALADAVLAVSATASAQGVEIAREIGDAPQVDVPEHVVGEVIRGLLANSLKALEGREDGRLWVRLDPYRSAGARVMVRIEDNGPGVPENVREHLFEPFVTQSSGRERLGLGLFLAASLLDMYDGRIRYESRAGGGASFVLELPPARFTRGQPYHWFAGGVEE
jgi:two-component system C4-dicarboxylate transport sensor histidine kinase DctB